MDRVMQRAARFATAVLAAGTVLGGAAFSPATAGATSTPLQPVASQYAPKGKPPPIGAAAAGSPKTVPGTNFAADPNSSFYYGVAYQYAVVDGASGYYTVAKPAVATGDFHSLAELAVESSDGQQAVEIGWTVDRGLNGDDNPHLFVNHWVDGNPTCYNGCGFVPFTDGSNQGVTAGMTLPVSATDVQQFWIQYISGGWDVGYNNAWLGYFPDSLWGGRFTKVGLTQWFGEVADAKPNTPCSEMGNGGYAASASAARIQNVGFIVGPGGPTADITISVTNPAYYTALKTNSASMSYGGQGACRTVPDIRGDNPNGVPNVLSAAGLVRGTVTPVTDPLCEDLNRVISQSPAPGSRVSAGALVNITYGVRPRTGCPNPRQ